MFFAKRKEWKLLLVSISLLLFACNDLIIKDDGQITVGLENCEGVSFRVLVKQPGKQSVTKVAKVEDGELELDVSHPGTGVPIDFDKRITVEFKVIGPGAEDCGIDGTRQFNGTADPVGIGDHKISLSDFRKL